ncbi:MAG: lipoate--protein ligase family protein [Planctomycetes bacterium]|nr:lipoate--protein ligase family protein [Planctomycetota bacterium]
MSDARAWRLLRSGPGTPSFNLACDEALLDTRGDGRPALRLYAWEPAALSLGRFQPLEPFVERAAAHGLTIVRRPTGGGAIHHDRELTFCLVATPGRDGYPISVEDAYGLVHEAVRRALESLGVPLRARGGDAPLSVKPRDATLCFLDTTAFDLVDVAGRKVVGSAQRRRDGRVLHHGSIPLEPPALSPGAGALSILAGRPVTWDEVADALVPAFSAVFGCPLHEGVLSDAERGAAQRLAAGPYADPRLPARGRTTRRAPEP